MTSKERAKLRGLANTMESLYQIGKGGISDNVIKQTEEALTARELIKLTVLDTSPEGTRETAEVLAAATNSEVVQVIGTKIILYRKNDKRQIIKL